MTGQPRGPFLQTMPITVSNASRTQSLSQHAGATARLAAPLAITQLSQMAMSLTDTVMLGSIGPEALAAGGLAASLAFSVSMLLQGVLSAVSVTVSHARGAEATHLVPRIYWTGLLLAGFLAVPAFIILSNVEPVLLAVHEPKPLAHGVARFCLVLRWGVPATLVGTGLMRSFLPAIGATQRLLWVALAGVVVNGLLNYGFIHGAWGLPGLGFLGSALATTVTAWLSALAILLLTHLHGATRPMVRTARPRWSVMAELLGIGWPVAITYGVEVAFFLVTSLMVGVLGATPLAAHQIAINIASLSFMVPLAIGQAANVRIAYWLGAGQPRAARQAGVVALALGTFSMLVSGAAMVVVPRRIVGFYLNLDDPVNGPTVEMAIALLLIAAVFQIGDGLQVVGSGCLRGYKDTRVPMLLAGFGYWGIGLPTGYYLGIVRGSGATGLWWGFAAGLTAVALLMSLRFERISRAPGAATVHARSPG